MATHDYVIDNQSAPAFRSDLNNALQAIVTQNSSPTAPTTTYANMIWYDTANNQLKKRNEAGSAWIVLGTIDEALGTFTPSGERALSSQAQAEAGSDNTTVMTPLRSAQAIAALAKPTYGTEVAATSGTAIGFTGIPSSATRIGLILDRVSTSANSNLLIQLGTSSGYITTGYEGAYFTQGGNTSVTGGLAAFNNNTGQTNSGLALWTKVGAGTKWVGNLTAGNPGNSSASGVALTVGGTVDRIRVTTAAGTPTFASGSINIFWE
jgi:hypothetical protein